MIVLSYFSWNLFSLCLPKDTVEKPTSLFNYLLWIFSLRQKGEQLDLKRNSWSTVLKLGFIERNLKYGRKSATLRWLLKFYFPLFLRHRCEYWSIRMTWRRVAAHGTKGRPCRSKWKNTASNSWAAADHPQHPPAANPPLHPTTPHHPPLPKIGLAIATEAAVIGNLTENVLAPSPRRPGHVTPGQRHPALPGRPFPPPPLAVTLTEKPPPPRQPFRLPPRRSHSGVVHGRESGTVNADIKNDQQWQFFFF